MTSKTAIQTLRDEAKEEFGLNGRIRLAWLLHRLIELEATEKKQIIEAYCVPPDVIDSAEDYYNQTYGQ